MKSSRTDCLQENQTPAVAKRSVHIIRLPREENTILAEIDSVSRRKRKRPVHIHLRIFTKQKPIGIHQVKIRARDLGTYQPIDAGGVTPGDSAKDVVDGIRPGERRRFTGLDVEI